MSKRDLYNSLWLLVPIKEASPVYAECRRLAEEAAEREDYDMYLSEHLVPAVVLSIKQVADMFEGAEASAEPHLSAQDTSICPYLLGGTVRVSAGDLLWSESHGYLEGTSKWPLTDSVGEWVADMLGHEGEDGEE